MACFLDLPLEIRTMIYEYCLVVQGEIVPYPAEYEYPRYKGDKKSDQEDNYMKRKPDVALLQVNKQIGEEARQILHGRNLWRVSLPSTKRNGESWRTVLSMYENVYESVRHVVTSFDVRDLGLEQSIKFHEGWNNRLPSPSYNDTDPAPQSRLDNIHYDRKLKLERRWDRKIDAMVPLSRETLIIDITNCWCPFGCCRMFAEMQWPHVEHLGQLPDKLIIKGVYNEKEVKAIKKGRIYRLSAHLEKNKTYTLSFRKEEHGKKGKYGSFLEDL
ncbi:MAG: hypothetical protein Q9222_005296 [Ikaeria aurantiellina]